MFTLKREEMIEQQTAQPVEFGPLLESGRICSGLDYYKPTMSQLAYECEPATEVTFTFHNRGSQRLADYVDVTKLQQRFDTLRSNGWSQDELDYMSGLKTSDGRQVFREEYLDYLKANKLPAVDVRHDETIDDLAIETTGAWALSTFWETIVMSELNEAYFEGYLQANGLNPLDVYEEGDRRLGEKIAILQANPDIKFADFGTRRHFSLRWQKYVVERLVRECPQNIVGTSNVALADSLDIKPIGTFAHEMPMVYAGLADARDKDIRSSHNRFLQDWFNRYGEDYSIALTDTFKTDFFFSDFTPDQAKTWHGVRQDSGDPYEFGERLIQFYEAQGIDPKAKTVVFSDGLEMGTIVTLHEHFKGRINVLFGWGTSLTNDLGIKPLNVVMKATHVTESDTGRNADTVKLSDNAGKHTGPPELVKDYEERYFAIN